MQTSARAIRGRALASNTEAKRILLVEDDTDLAMLLRDYLEGYFYRVTTVTNGVDGLKAIMDSDFDVIVCDVVMPKMPGDMFYRAVQRIQPRLCERFLFITAHGENPRVMEFLNQDRKSTRLNSSHGYISYAVFCLKKKNTRDA